MHFTGLTMRSSVPMDECQSSHIKNIMTRLTTIKCDKNVVCITLSFALDHLMKVH